jgi:hypothetical protein
MGILLLVPGGGVRKERRNKEVRNTSLAPLRKIKDGDFGPTYQLPVPEDHAWSHDHIMAQSGPEELKYP